MKISVSVILCLLFLFFYSCKKKERLETVAQPAVHSSPLSLLPARDSSFEQQLFAATVDFSGELQQTNRVTALRRTLVPLSGTRFSKLHLYYLTETSAAGRVSVYRVISNKAVPRSINLFELIPDLHRCIYYSPEATDGRIAKLVVRAGNKKMDLRMQHESPAIFLQKDRACEGRPPVCIDWYWTEYNPDTGEVYSELYVGTTCYDPCIATGGAGGNAATLPSYDCESTIESIDQNSGGLAIKRRVDICGTAATTRTKCYYWRVYAVSDGLLASYLLSVERGVQSNLGNNQWQFISFTHESISPDGIQILYSAKASNVMATASLIQSGHTAAYDMARMHLSFNVNYSIICDGLPILYNPFVVTSNTWSVAE